MTVKTTATLFWANLNQVNEMSGKYQVDLANLSDSAVIGLKALGLTINKREDDAYNRGNFITCKSTYPIKAILSSGELVPLDTKIGNGTEADVEISSYNWKFKAKTGCSPSLLKLTITNLVEYVPQDLEAA